MNCPRCGRQITGRRKRCEVCGQDISMYGRLYRLSNSFYNKGLERARVRDLGGAVEMLKKSLEINKENTNARNLLGLVYFELGEAVAALTEWVISKHFDPDGNDAERLMEKVQSDSVKFEALNQTIRKYNLALAHAKQGSDDLAVVQLKKVISMNPHYVRALLLLALIYMKNYEYEKAKRCLQKVQKVDVTNVMALRYLEEIRRHTEPQTADGTQKREEEAPLNSAIVPVNSYREDKPNFIAFLTFFLGILIGVAVIYYMAVPNIRRSITEEYNQKERDYSATLSARETEISSLESNIRILETKIDDMERTLRREDGYVLTDYEPLLTVLYRYQEYLADAAPTQEQAESLFAQIEAVDMSAVTHKAALALYADMRKEVGRRAAGAYLTRGISLYTDGKDEEACTVLEEAYRYCSEEPETLFYLARVYHSLGRTAEAAPLYRLLMSDYSESPRYAQAQAYLAQIEETP